MSDYKSSVLRCHPEDDGCLVCEFLSGARTEKHLLEVIRILDGTLADEEQQTSDLAGCLVAEIDKVATLKQVIDGGPVEGAPDGTCTDGVPTAQNSNCCESPTHDGTGRNSGVESTGEARNEPIRLQNK